jgi:release factor glutamine methyltransferase
VQPPTRADVVARLAAAGCVAAAGEADELIDAAPDARVLDAWIARRAEGEPLAWIIGRVAFAGRRLHAAPGVYVPRPQTEALARRATRLLPRGGRAVDLCTGTGAIAAVVRAHDPTAFVVGTDIDPRAVRCARHNRVPALVGDLAAPIAGTGTWDLVTAVAPYVPTDDLRLLPADVQRHEPRVALDGGTDGLDRVRGVVDAARRLLRPGGYALLEIGGAQDEMLQPSTADFGSPDVWRDEDGDVRGIALRRA